MNKNTAQNAREHFISAFDIPDEYEEEDSEMLPFPEDTDGLPADVDPQWCIASYRNPMTNSHVSVWLLDDETAQPYYDAPDDEWWGEPGPIEIVASDINDNIASSG
jgi:hypothetical protein